MGSAQRNERFVEGERVQIPALRVSPGESLARPVVRQCPGETNLVAVVDRGEGDEETRAEPDAGPVVAGDGEKAGGVVAVEQIELGELDWPSIPGQGA
jgi:hypothetical protein